MEFEGMPRSFWDNKMRTMQVSGYFLSTLLQELGSIFMGAHYLWHPWGKQRAQELSAIGYRLIDKAEQKRIQGWGWAGNDTGFGNGVGSTLVDHRYKRYYGRGHKEELTPHPEAVPCMIAFAVEFILHTLPLFKHLENKYYQLRNHWVPELEKIIEDMMESPCIGNDPIAIPKLDVAYKSLEHRAFMHECEILALTQASIEESFHRENKTTKHKKTRLTQKQIQALLESIGWGDDMLNVLKHILAEQESPWRGIATLFEEQAKEDKETILCILSSESNIQDIIRTAWYPGMTTKENLHAFPCYSKDTLRKTETLTKGLTRALTCSRFEWMNDLRENQSEQKAIASET
ncbi:MAG: hypothetical protein COU47_03910 [Candidatus Niyogibacteria bacterium CG10_big_fil_rev_8_21_14_0_10_46_36]|uniref:Uncharacterized protein n=1 Tax=Candidatus Niyogibacteria bacterium CG10_big_fil_rev_8_21_14_0_10_46_36 TaxID=1974726 RepID=A0A2H0TCD5_9BACT|nr:MAG: hypothetical protein COU47_03910 [Candidatus Niyogibacteria bacterium CG10_big_fil_rev_8_21_14_0_10_46_36]